MYKKSVYVSGNQAGKAFAISAGKGLGLGFVLGFIFLKVYVDPANKVITDYYKRNEAK
jgi:hypothetical protein